MTKSSSSVAKARMKLAGWMLPSPSRNDRSSDPRLPPFDWYTGDLAELPDDHDDRDSSQVADQDWLPEQIGDETERAAHAATER